MALQTTDGENRVYIYAALMFVIPLFGAVCYAHSSRIAIATQIRIRAELTAAVYRKVRICRTAS